MLSLTSTKTNKPIAIIEGGKFNKSIVYLDSNSTQVEFYKGNNLLNEKLNKEINIVDGKFFIYPNLETQDAIYCAGPRGSGKSTFMAHYAKLFKSIFKNVKFIYLVKFQKMKLWIY